MNEQYLRGYFDTYVKPQRADATYEDWLSKIQTNDAYKRGMFDSNVKPNKADASYDDWNSKVFGSGQPVPQDAATILPPETNESEPTAFEKGAHATGGFNRVVTDVVPDLLKGAGIATQYAANKLGNVFGQEDAPIESNVLYSLGDKVAKWKEENVEYSDPRLADSFVYSDLPQGLGSVAAVMASGGRSLFGTASGLAKAGTKTLAKEIGSKVLTPQIATGGVMMAVPEYEAAKEAGLSEDEAFGVFVKNFALGATESIPIENALNFINKTTGGGIMRALKSGAVGSLEEATQEAVQTYTSNLIAQGSYDLERDPLAGVWRSMLAGGIIGGGLSGVGGAVSRGGNVEVNKEIAESTTGNVEIDQEIDAQTKDAIEVVAPTEAIESPQTNATTQQEVANVEPTIAEDTTVEQPFDPKPIVQEAIYAKPVLTQERFTEMNQKTEEGKPFKLTPQERQENITRILQQKDVTEKGQINAFVDEWNKQENRPFGLTKNDAKAITETIAPTDGKPFNGEKLTVSVQESIKRVTKQFVKGLTKGVRKGQEFKNKLIKEVADTLKASPLSRRQTASILRKIKATNAFTPGSVSRLNEFVRNTVEKADYTQKVNQANTLLKAVKQTAKKGSIAEKDAANKFKQIDPTSVEDIDKYIAVASMFKGTPVIKEVNAYVDQELSRQSIQAEQDKVIDKESLTADLGEEFTPEEVESVLDDTSDLDDTIEESKQEKAKRVLKERARVFQASLPDSPSDRLEYGNQKRDSEILSTLKNFDVDYFTSAQELKEFNKALNRAAVNNDFGGSSKYQDTQRAIEGYTELGKDSKDFNLIGTLWDLKFRSMLSSVDVYVDAIFGKIAKHSSKFKLYTGWGGISKAQAEAIVEEKALIDLLEGMKKKYPKAFATNKMKFIRGVYNKLVTRNQEEDPTEALQLNKELIERDIETYKAEGNSNKELSLLTELYAPFKNAQTMEEVESIMKRVAPESKIVHDALVEFYSKYAKEVQDYNYYYYNTKSPVVVNYAGPRQYIKVGDAGAGVLGAGFDANKDVNPDEITKKFNWVPNALKSTPKQTASARARSAKVTKNDNGDIQPKVNKNTLEYSVMNYNLDGVAETGIRKTINEMRSLPHMMQVRMFANNKKAFFELMGGQNKNTMKIWNDLFGAGGIYENFEKASLDKLNSNSTPFEKGASKVLNFFRNIAYTMALSGPSQLIKQQIVLANTALKLGKYSKYLAVNIDKAENFLKGRAISTRESQQSIFNISTYEDTTTLNKQLSDFSSSNRVQKRKEIMGWIGGLKFLTKSDASAAKRSYLAFYRQHLAKNDAEFKGWDQEKVLENDKVRQEAHAYADHMVGLLQTPSNPAEGAQALKTTSVLGSLAKGIFIPYGSFALNQKRRMINDFDTLVKGTAEQKIKAAKDIAATGVEITAFNLASWGLRGAYGAVLFELFKSLYPDIEDETEEEKLEKRKRFERQLYTNLLLDLVPTILTQPEPLQPILPYMVNNGWMKWTNSRRVEDGLPEMTKKEFEQEIGNPLSFYPKRTSDNPAVNVIESLGMYGAAFDAASEVTKGIENVKNDGEKQLNDDQVRLAYLITILETGALLGVVPSDLKFAARREMNRQKKTARKRSNVPEYFR